MLHRPLFRRSVVVAIAAAALAGCMGTSSTVVSDGEAADPAPAAVTPPSTVPPATAVNPPAVPAAPSPSRTPAAAPAPSRPANARARSASPAPATPPLTAAARPAADAAASGPKVLERGVVHQWVVYSQRRLNTLGYGPLDVDGRFGPDTQAAVVRFEQTNTTVVDGRLEAEERLLLLSNDAVAAEPVPQPVPAATTPALPPEKLVIPPSEDGLATAETARTNGNCQAIEAEFLRQGAEPDVADQFAYVIAPRESGCIAQHVSTATDLSYSRLGLNFIGVMPRYWGPLCGVTDYRETAELSVDVRCGLAAYRALGWKPWT